MAGNQQDKLEEIADSIRCPICEEIPSGEIFVCLIGHSICSECFNHLEAKVCPSCRSLYGDPKTRNFALEDAASKVPINCPYHCPEKVSRKDLPKHKKTCSEGRKYANLCKSLHVDNRCNFEINTDDARAAVDHFTTAHNAMFIKKLHNNSFVLCNVSYPWAISRCPPIIFKAPARCYDADGDAESYFLAHLFAQSESISWRCVYLGNSTTGAAAKYDMLLTFTSKKVLVAQPSLWNIPVEEAPGLQESSPDVVQFSRNVLVQEGFVLEDDSMPYRIDIVRKKETN